jgi:hypothetical protein
MERRRGLIVEGMGSYADQPVPEGPVSRLPDRTLELPVEPPPVLVERPTVELPAAGEVLPRTVPAARGELEPVDRTPLAGIGEITVTRDRIYTPTGWFRLRGSRWTVTERPYVRQRIPSWAIALAIVLFLCVGPFSLLFLLASETVYAPWLVEVSVRNGRHHYVARLPVADPVSLQYLHHQVNYVRQLAAL